MRAARVLLISAVAHAGLFAVLSRVALERTSSVVAPHASVPAPIEVVMLDPELAAAVPAATTTDPSTAKTPRRQERRIESPRSLGGLGASAIRPYASGSSNEPGLKPDSGLGTGKGFMKMRGADLHLGPGVAERIAASGEQPLRDGPHRSGKLESVSGGGAVVHDLVTTMTIAPDGKAKFHDKPDIDLHWKLPIPHLDIEGMRHDAGQALTKWFADPEAGKRFGRTQDLARHLQAVPGACDDWGSVWCDDPLAPDSEKYAREQKKTKGSLLGGNADISAYLYRKFAGDPYASRKLKLLDDTREERVAMGEEFRAQQRGRSSELVHRNLERLWARVSHPIERKAALFEIWDECGEGEGADGEAGQRARAIVIGWIRTHIPQGSVGSYTDEELATLDARRASKQPFSPY